MIDGFASAREEYKPDSVGLLWIAESPPAQHHSFFYHDQTTGRDNLFRETMRAVGFWPDNEPMRKGVDKHPLLEKFRSSGYYLVDTCPYPVNKLPDDQRRKALERHLPMLAETASKLNPANILVVKSNVYELVVPALKAVGFQERVLNKSPINFPSHGWQIAYRSRLRRILRNRLR